MKLQILAFLVTVLIASASATEQLAESPSTQDSPALSETNHPTIQHIDGKTPADKKATFLDYCSSADISRFKEARGILPYLAARIVSGKEVDASLKKWQEVADGVYQNSKIYLLANPSDGHAPNPFEKHALIHAYLVCKEKTAIPQSLVDLMKGYVALYKHKEWKGYGALNYRLMNDGSGYLAAELWPDLIDADGLNAEQIKTATKARLLGYFEQIVHRNTDEYGAPTYLGIDLSAMKMLSDFAKDYEVKNKATLTLDSMMLQVACAWNHGYYITPASRAKYWGTSMTSPDSLDTTGAIGWLCFGGNRPVDPARMNPPGSIWFAMGSRSSNYAPPPLFSAIANDRTSPFLHQGSTGEKIRFMIYHTPSYSLASEWEFLPAPTDGHYKESRRAMLKWISDKPCSTFIPMQDNPRRPYRLSENIANAFGYGENPYAQCLQQEGTLIGITSVPENFPFWKLYAPFTTEGAILKRIERNDWVFCHGGSVLFAFRYAKPATWEKHREKEQCDVLCSLDRKNGWVLETSPITPFAGGGVDLELERFATAILAKPRLDVSKINDLAPSLSYHALSGHNMELTYRDHKEPYSSQHRIDGKTVDYRSYPLFGNPWVSQTLGSDHLTLHHNGEQMTYDFKNWSCSSLRNN